VLNGILARGTAGLVLITGAPGMGKRTILGELRKKARNRHIVPAEGVLAIDGDTTIDAFISDLSGAAEHQAGGAHPQLSPEPEI